MTRLIVISTVRIYLEGVQHLLQRDGRLRVVAAAPSVPSACRTLANTRADAALVSFADDGGLRRVQALARRFPDLRVVAMGVPEDEADILACAEAGVAGFVCLNSSVDDLVEAVEAAMAGKLHCTGRVAGALLRRVGALAVAEGPEEPGFRLTSREVEVAGCLDEGLTNKEIASRLHIEVSTVKNHVHNILDKVGAHTRGEAAARVRPYLEAG